MIRRVDLSLLTALFATLLALAPSAQRSYAERLQAQLEGDVETDAERFDLMLRRARALMSWSVPEGLEAVRLVVGEADRAGLDEYRSLALAIEARVLAETEGAAAGIAGMRRAREVMPPDAATVHHGYLDVIEVGILHLVDEFGRAASTLDRALELARSSGDARLQADCLLELHDLLHVTGAGIDADEDLRRAETLFRTIDDEVGLVRVRARELDLFLREGEDERFEARLDELERRAEELGSRRLALLVLNRRYGAALQASDLDGALRIAREALATSEALGSEEQLAWGLDRVAWALLMSERPDEAAPFVERALDVVERLGMRNVEHAVRDSAAELAIAREDGEALLEHSKRLTELARMGLGTAAREESQARMAMDTLRSEQRALNERARQREAALERAQLDNERRVRFYRWFAAGTALFLTSALALILFLGKRRAEATHRRLLEQTELARRTEEARKRLEDQLARIERLDGIGLLSAGIAHDFNNILCSISGNAALLRRKSGGRSRVMAEEILHASRRAADLCSRLLDYAQPTPDDREVTDLADLVAGVRPLLEVGRGAVSLFVEPSHEANLVEVDKSAIEQVLVNLVTNAVDDSVGASQVTIRLTRARNAEDDGRGRWFGRPELSEEYVRLEVADDGEGMNDAHLRRVFDPFYTTKFEGRGLGLSAAYGIVTSHGGAFHVTSERGSGSVFSVYLPAHHAGVPPADGEREFVQSLTPAPRVGDRRVLVVDDEPAILSFVQHSLGDLGYEVEVASSAPEALRILREDLRRIDVLLLDLSMPEMDGTELLTRLRLERGELPTLVMSGHGERFVTDRLNEHGVAGTLRKPFELEALRAAIEDAVSRPRVGSEPGA